MTWWRRLWIRKKMEVGLEKELRFHLDQHTADLIAQGLDPEEARRRARLALGGPEQVKEQCRDARGTRWLENLLQDLRYGARMLMKKPGFTLVAVITLAAGIAANTTIFSTADALILRPFNFPNQERLVMVWERGENEGGFDHVAPGNFSDWREQSQSFDRLIAIDQRSFNLTGAYQPELFGGHGVSAGFFDALGVKPALGRAFLPGEDEPGRDQVVMLKHSLWERRFGVDPDIVGKTLTINAKTFTVIGVMPPDFNFPFNGGEMWVPLAFDDKTKQERGGHYLRTLGLLKPGVSIAQANADLDAISRRAQRLFPETNTGRSAIVVDMTEDFVRNVGAKMYMTPLIGTVVFVLLIACANVANMLFGRAFGRQKEIAVRLALGASRWRLVRQLLTEGLLLSLVGGVVGLLLSVWAVDLLRGAMPKDLAKFIPGFDHFGVNRVVLLFTLMISILTGVLFGLMPAWQASKPNLNEALKEGAKGASSTGSRHRLRGALVVAEVALSLVLLVGAGLMIRSFVAMLRDDIGFSPQSVLSFQLSLSGEKYSEAHRRSFYDQLLKRLEALPGVVAAGATNILPMSNNRTDNTFEIVGRPFEKGKVPAADYRVVTPGYFSAIGMSLRRGRGFTAGDNEQAPRVVIINETLARLFFPNEEAIGQRIIPGGADKPLEIVGIVRDIKDRDLDRVYMPGFYVPYAQDPCLSMGVAMRAAAEPTALAAAARDVVMKLDPAQPVHTIKTVERLIYERSSPKRIMTAMMGVFAAIALLLAGVGLYAVIAYAVSQRTHEIGVRLALGARSRDILRLITRQGLKLTLAGLGLGMAGAFALTRVMEPLLYGVTTTDPLTFILISLSLAGVALLACWIPARRATKVDPLVALRFE